MEPKYKVFKRSCTNWTQFARGKKTTIRRGLTYAEARQMCVQWNAERTPAQKSRGTMYEFTQE